MPTLPFSGGRWRLQALRILCRNGQYKTWAPQRIKETKHKALSNRRQPRPQQNKYRCLHAAIPKPKSLYFRATVSFWK